jgi:hypothetical protein
MASNDFDVPDLPANASEGGFNVPDMPQKKGFWSELYEREKPAITTSYKMLRDAAAGIGQYPLNIMNFIDRSLYSPGAFGLTPQEGSPAAMQAEQEKTQPYQPMQLPYSQTPMGRVGTDVFAPMIFGGKGAQMTAGAVERMGLKPLQELAAKITGQAGTQAGMTYAEERGEGLPPEMAGKGALIAGALGGAGELAAGGVRAGRELGPTRMAEKEAARIGEQAREPSASELSPENAIRQLEELKQKGIDEDLFDVGTMSQNESAMDRYNRVYSRFAPDEAGMRARDQAANKMTEEVYNAHKKDFESGEQAMQTAVGHVKERYQADSGKSRALYAERNKIAEDNNYKVTKFPLYDELIQKRGNQLKDADKYITDLAERIKNGEPIPFKDIDDVIINLGEDIAWSEAGSPQNKFYKSLRKALQDDTYNGAISSDIPELYEAESRARNFFKKNMSHYNDNPSLYRLATGEVADLKDFKKVFRDPNASRTEYIKKLPEEARDAARFHNLVDDMKFELEGDEKIYQEAMPYTILQHYKKLPKELKNIYYGPEGKAEMKAFKHMLMLKARSKAELSAIRTGEQTAKAIMELRQKGIPTTAEKLWDRIATEAQKGYYKRRMAGLRGPRARAAFQAGKAPRLEPATLEKLFRGSGGTVYGGFKYLTRDKDKK